MLYTYPLEFKIKAIRRYEKGESSQSLCQELHIAQSTTTGKSSFLPSQLHKDHSRRKNLMLFHASSKSWNIWWMWSGCPALFQPCRFKNGLLHWSISIINRTILLVYMIYATLWALQGEPSITIFADVWQNTLVLQWGASLSNSEIPNTASLWGGLLLVSYQKVLFN